MGQILDLKLQKGNSWRYPGISGSTYCLTSCSLVVMALVYQPSGLVSIPVMSHSEGENLNDAAATYRVVVYYMLMC